jgi:hypothetical protein
LSTPESDRPGADQYTGAHGGVQRRLYHGHRHQRPLQLSGYRTAAALLGIALIAMLVILAVAVSPRHRSKVVLPQLPPSTPTAAATDTAATDTAAPTRSAADRTGATQVPSQPPLPSAGTTTAPPPPRTSPPAKPPADPPHHISAFSVEAEAGTSLLIGRARIRSNNSASGRHTIGDVGTDPRNPAAFGALVVNALTVPTRGTYTLTVFYASGRSDRQARIRVDGTILGTVTFPSTGRTTAIGSLTLRVGLAAGGNAVEFDNPNAFTPDFDRVVVSN